jgi:methionine synthase II (cobalamin-independent)
VFDGQPPAIEQTYAPWLNPIEKLWRWVRQDVLKMHRWVEDWPQVKQRVWDFLAQFERIAAAVASPVMLGFHFCYGDLAHRHLVEPADLSLSVRMANLAISSVKRSVAWIHMPVPINRSDDAYFAPLRELKSGDAKVFLGLIHLHDGTEGSLKRAEVARRYLSGFGIATECGLGRRPSETLPDVLRIHREVAERLASTSH